MSSIAFLAAGAALALLLRALLVAAGAALAGVSPERAGELLREAPTLGRAALARLKRDDDTASATTRGASAVLLALSASLAAIAASDLAQPPWLPAAGAALLVTFAAMLTELGPRSLAIAEPDLWAERLAIPVLLLLPLLGPPARLAGALVSRLGVPATFKLPVPGLEDIERILARGGRADEDAPPPQLVHSIFRFSATTAREVMVPRAHVVALPLDVSPDELVRLLAEEGHSRVPVYEGSIDQIVGVLHTRDVVPLLAHPELIKLADVVRPPVFVPWATRIGDLLEEMQRRRIHMAMVTDEHGGFMGIVTLEDIIEQIVGDIRDEFDEPEAPQVQAMPDGTHAVQADIGIADFNRLLGVELPEHDGFDTLAGFLNHLAGQIPEQGAVLSSHGLSFTVAQRSPRRVERVRVAREESTAEAG